jgi:type II secretion system protein G
MPLRRSAFTLVEILIVVVILGILAAIVVPQFMPASEITRANTNFALLRTLRSQLELYQTHHEAYPTLAQMWTVLTERTEADGSVSPTGKFGPYLEREPINAFTGSTTVVAPAAASAADGWTYDEATGVIRAVGFDESTGKFTRP